MGFPESSLAAGERIVVHHHPHWKRLLWPSIVVIVATALAGVAAGLIERSDLEPPSTQILWIVLATCWSVVVVWFFLRPVIVWRSEHFVVTDRAVSYRTGVFTHSSIQIPLHRINSVEYRAGILDRMLRTGTLEIESAADDPLAISDVPKVARVRQLLSREVMDR